MRDCLNLEDTEPMGGLQLVCFLRAVEKILVLVGRVAVLVALDATLQRGLRRVSSVGTWLGGTLLGSSNAGGTAPWVGSHSEQKWPVLNALDERRAELHVHFCRVFFYYLETET